MEITRFESLNHAPYHTSFRGKKRGPLRFMGKVAMAPVKVVAAPFKYAYDHPIRSLGILAGAGLAYTTAMFLDIRHQINKEAG